MLGGSCQIEATSSDNRFAYGSCHEVHATLLGYSYGPEWSDVYSVKQRKIIATLKQKKITSLLFASLGGKNYLLELTGGKQLSVYEFKD